MNTLPPYYSSLAPFLSLFASGHPILTYHKLGPRPRKVRLRGLYLSAELFDQQLAELRASGFTNEPLSQVITEPPASTAGITLTFDDGYQNALRYGLEPLAKHGFQAIQYLVANRLGQLNDWDVRVGEAPEPLMSEPEVRDWLAAGHEIGSHTSTHPYLTRIPINEAKNEIQDSKKRLEDTFGVPIQHFCYPYGDWNPIVRDIVIEAGYLTAVTTDFGVNTLETSPFELKRITARYPSKNWRTALRFLQNLFDHRKNGAD